VTIIQDRIEDVAGQGLRLPVIFQTGVVRDSAAGDAIVAPVRHRFDLAKEKTGAVSDGMLSTTDLDPGPATVTIPGNRGGVYSIVIPVSSTPVRLWPLIDAGMPTPPASEPGFIRNGGGVARAEAVTASEYASLTFDPATLYVIVDEEAL